MVSVGPTTWAAFFHRAADLAEVFEVGARADVHVQASDGEVVACRDINALFELFVPDTVFGLFATCVGFLAVPVAESGVDAEGDAAARNSRTELVDHVGRAAVDVDVVLDNEVEGFLVENVGGVDNLRRLAGACLVADSQGAADFKGADRVDENTIATDKVEQRQVRCRFLGVARDVELGEVSDALDDRGSVVDECRGAELLGKVSDRVAGEGFDLGGEAGGHDW